MGINCGSTGGIPDCLGAQNSVWQISYIIPRPGVIRYRYSAWELDWNEIIMLGGALDYRLIDIPASPGQCPALYRFYCRYQRRPESEWIYVEFNMRGQVGPIKRISLVLSASDTYPGVEQFGFPVIAVEGMAIRSEFFLNVFTEDPQTGEEILVWYPFGDGSGRHNIVRAEFLSMERLDGTPDNCGAKCKFEVFNPQGNIVFTRTEDICPDVEKIPCKLFPEDEVTINVDPRNIPIGLYLPNKGKLTKVPFVPKGLQVTLETSIFGDRKRALVQVVLATGGSALPRSAQTILDLYSPKGCNLYPKICWKCEPCKECPKETCLKVLNRPLNKICCYGKNGKVIATVDPDCDTADC
jgi:hypothetical protein